PKTSLIWQVFEEGPPDKEGRNAVCTVPVGSTGTPCGARFKYNSGHGTSALMRHLRNQHIQAFNEAECSKNRGSASTTATGSRATTAVTSGQGSGGIGVSSIAGPSRAVNSCGSSKKRKEECGRYVLMCCMGMLPLDTMTEPCFSPLLEHLSPGYSWRSLSPEEVNKQFIHLYDGLVDDITRSLKSHHQLCQRFGYKGPCFGVQVGRSRGYGAVEFCTLTVSFIPADFRGVERLALSMRPFFDPPDESGMKTWIKQVTAEWFGFMGSSVCPSDVYLCATTRQGCSSSEAFEALGVPLMACSVHRLGSCVESGLGLTWSPGGDPTQSPAQGAATGASKNPEMGRMVTAAMDDAEKFVLLAPGSFTPGEMQADRDRLGMVLHRRHVYDTRWTSVHASLNLIIHLQPALDRYYSHNQDAHPQAPAPASTKWQAIREAVSVLDASAEAGAVIGGEKGVFIGQAIRTMLDLHTVFKMDTQEIRGGEGKVDGGVVQETAVSSLAGPTRVLLGTLDAEMVHHGLGEARGGTEKIALLLDPRLKMCRPDTCRNGGSALAVSATETLQSILKELCGWNTEASNNSSNCNSDSKSNPLVLEQSQPLWPTPFSTSPVMGAS
ncbi:unnamed protein product, partial [Discosporangium mesarthrocarpum]